MTGTLLDTSAVIAGPVEVEGAAAISTITLGELRAGVALAPTADIRATREARFAALRNAFEPLPVDEVVADRYGEILARAKAAGRITKATDLLIIATAAATGRTLLTLDRRQAGLAGQVGVATSTGG